MRYERKSIFRNEKSSPFSADGGCNLLWFEKNRIKSNINIKITPLFFSSIHSVRSSIQTLNAALSVWLFDCCQCSASVFFVGAFASTMIVYPLLILFREIFSIFHFIEFIPALEADSANKISTDADLVWCILFSPACDMQCIGGGVMGKIWNALVCLVDSSDRNCSATKMPSFTRLCDKNRWDTKSHEHRIMTVFHCLGELCLEQTICKMMPGIASSEKWATESFRFVQFSVNSRSLLFWWISYNWGHSVGFRLIPVKPLDFHKHFASSPQIHNQFYKSHSNSVNLNDISLSHYSQHKNFHQRFSMSAQQIFANFS